MRRREALAGLGSLGVFGAGAAFAFGDLGLSGNEERVESVELPQIDAPGSTADTAVVPESGRVTYVTMFATWCSTCKAKMDPLNEAARNVADTVQFISVTNEAIGQTVQPADVAEWWREHDGNWPVAYDEDLALTQALDASGVPYSAVIDANNRVTSTELGYSDAEAILNHIEDAK
ncbi:TlpA family protein disulfide reductase [Halovenus rubra]|uniref:TlpA family protein disulfide reductase n=2 Tax=Halovenus rubra TaxID=869890 RepID=A0ACC7E2J3_9EURY|nr:TlpA disulfide reductase family protein [Halovenus rubra]